MPVRSLVTKCTKLDIYVCIATTGSIPLKLDTPEDIILPRFTQYIYVCKFPK